jgi:hypothetical protein
MIAKIYEAMARKDLSFGCRIHNWRNWIIIWKDYDENWETWRYRIIDDWENVYTTINPLTIIGHPVLLSDVLNYIDDNEKWQDDKSKHWDILLWNSLYETGKYSWNMSIPTINNQSIDCIEYIYNLIN